jgi:hypothetical protein
MSPTQRPLPDNTKRTEETDIHAPDGIRTHNLSKRGATDPRLRRARPLGSTAINIVVVKIDHEY